MSSKVPTTTRRKKTPRTSNRTRRTVVVLFFRSLLSSSRGDDSTTTTTPPAASVAVVVERNRKRAKGGGAVRTRDDASPFGGRTVVIDHHERDPTERDRRNSGSSSGGGVRRPSNLGYDSEEGPPSSGVESRGGGRCALDSDGFYGVRSSSAAGRVDVSFEYELETDPSLYDDGEGGDLESSGVLRAVERAFADLILPALFTSRCDGSVGSVVGGETGSERRHLQRGGLGGSAVGVSSYPDDFVLNGVRCRSETSRPFHECAVVIGGLVVFTENDDGGATTTDMEEDVVSSIAGALSRTTAAAGEEDPFDFGAYHESIVRVAVISIKSGNVDGDVLARETPGPPPPEVESDGSPEGEAFPPYGYVAVGASALTILALIAARWRRGRHGGPDKLHVVVDDGDDEGRDEEDTNEGEEQEEEEEENAATTTPLA